LVNQLAALQPEQFQEAVIALNHDAKKLITMTMFQEDPSVLCLIEAQEYVNILAFMKKEEMMPGFMAISKENLVNMTAQLPAELTAQWFLHKWTQKNLQNL